ncbi:Uncharacterized protein HII31_01754 [Pseudocercospora fuligena]|uniref:Copper acquisition factor BIM1-like domain-containing protein n=1 Tax=Pseudocercospora fuligena TaxID=685502 RepID=A0A8H6RV86_9PEZI|nr:Uncharacterized protein HII31_01754 [Pseudocercospora fuligena]
MLRSVYTGLIAASLASAHFTLDWPPNAGFIDDDEPTAPCGGATVVVNDTSPQVQVERFAVSIFSSHPAGSWSFFATTDTEEPYNFTEIVPVVNSTGVGKFCLTDLRAPDDFAGKAGIIQVIDSSVDGTLYQCAPVNFVTGSNSTTGSACTNATGFTATWTSESTNSSESSSSPSSSETTASATSSAGAAMATAMGSVVGLGMLAAGLIL